MKRQISFLLSIFLFLNSCSVLYGMRQHNAHSAKENSFAALYSKSKHRVAKEKYQDGLPEVLPFDSDLLHFTLLDSPNEILFEIFDYLDKKDLLNVRLAEKRFQEVLEDSVMHAIIPGKFAKGAWGLQYEKIKVLLKKLQEKLKKYKKVYVLHNKLEKLDNEEDIKDKIHNIFKKKIFQNHEKMRSHIQDNCIFFGIFFFLICVGLPILVMRDLELTKAAEIYLCIFAFFVSCGPIVIMVNVLLEGFFECKLFQEKTFDEIFGKISKNITVLLHKILRVKHFILINKEVEEDKLKGAIYTEQELLEKKNN